MGKTHLVIPDSHAHADHHNRRYDYLGHLINDIKPDVVVDIGDWFDMPSLCSYDRGKKSFEGRRYSRDIAAGVEAQDRMLSIVKRQKKRLPRFVRTLGNHENRINKVVESDPILLGTIGIEDLQSKEYGFEEYPFLQSVKIDGVNYAHYFTSGVMNRPVPNARQLLQKKMQSCTMGHSHLFDHVVEPDVEGNKINACIVGVFQDYDADYAGPANRLWSRGVVVKRGVENGQYDLEWISLKRLKEAYKNAGR